jgi:hypothetical protein
VLGVQEREHRSICPLPRRETLHSSKKLDPGCVRHLVIAGWTGRDRAAVEAHIHELEAIGVRRPATIPVFYRVAASLLTTDERIEVVGDRSSGEVECVAFSFEDGIFIGLGSDHTDRAAETVNVSLSKQACAKPVGSELWRLEDVAPHWDALMLRSYIRNGDRHLYQEGSMAAIRTLPELFRLYAQEPQLPPGTAMFCGTVPVKGKIASSTAFEMEMHDPVLKRTLTHTYRVEILPDRG